jgi:putative endonuclease
MYYVYILYSETLEKKYIGMTDDLKRRVEEHNRGKSIFTRTGDKWKLIYYEAFLNKTDARREELFLKSGKGRERLKFLFQETTNNGEVA